MLTIIDANVLVASLIDSDDKHDEAVSIIEALGTPLHVPALVLAEVSYFLDDVLGASAELALLKAIVDGDILPIYFDEQWPRMLQIATKYQDRRLGAADSSVIYAAERSFTTRIASMDRRDLEGIQLANGKYVEVISFKNQV